jgi:hypothetical protein
MAGFIGDENRVQKEGNEQLLDPRPRWQKRKAPLVAARGRRRWGDGPMRQWMRMVGSARQWREAGARVAARPAGWPKKRGARAIWPG